MLKLYKFQANYGRYGTLEGVFVEDEERVARAIGKNVYFGEVLGKHSEVDLDLQEYHFKVMTEDQTFIHQFEKLALATGYNPFDYMEDEEDNEENE
jgi:hypothetical protein